MKIDVVCKDSAGNILELVTSINKTLNLTAGVLKEKTKDGDYVIRIESLDNEY